MKCASGTQVDIVQDRLSVELLDSNTSNAERFGLSSTLLQSESQWCRFPPLKLKEEQHDIA